MSNNELLEKGEGYEKKGKIDEEKEDIDIVVQLKEIDIRNPKEKTIKTEKQISSSIHDLKEEGYEIESDKGKINEENEKEDIDIVVQLKEIDIRSPKEKDKTIKIEKQISSSFQDSSSKRSSLGSLEYE